MPPIRSRPGFRKLLDRRSFDLRLGLLNVFKKKTSIEGGEHFDIVVGCAFGEVRMPLEIECIKGFRPDPADVVRVNTAP